jgi:hypothetical protein
MFVTIGIGRLVHATSQTALVAGSSNLAL